MKYRKYSHNFKEVVTDKFVVRLEDKSEGSPTQVQAIKISGLFSQDAYLSVDSAKELELALHKVLLRTPTKANQGGE